MRTRIAFAWGLVALAAAAPVHAAPRPRAATHAATAPPSLLEGVELFQVDAPHSMIGFTVPWMGISRVRGSFHDFLGVIAIDTRDFTRSSVSLAIPVGTIDTGFERRDKDLKSANFFDVEKFPTATFTSRSIAKTAEGYVLRGDFTLHGVTRAIEIPFTDNGRIHDSVGDERVGFEGRLTIRRSDYGIDGPARFNVALEKGLVIGQEVELPLALEGWRAAPRDTLQDRASDSLYRRIGAVGTATVAQQWRALRATTPDSLMAVEESVLNTVGYALLAHQRVAEALEMFALETEIAPTSAFAQVGLAQAYAMAGDRARAIAACEKALERNPRAVRAMEILRRVKPAS